MFSLKGSSHLKQWESGVLHEGRSSCQSRSASPKRHPIPRPSFVSGFQIRLRRGEGQDSQVREEDVTVKGIANLSANHVLSRAYQQAFSQHHGQRFVQGQVCMLNFDSFEDQREILTQRFRNASTRLRRALTPPPRRGSVLSEARDSSDSGIQSEDHLFTQRLGQDVSVNQPLLATRSWSFTQLMECCYQIVMKMINKSKQVAALFVNVTQVKIHIVQNTHFNQRRSQEIQGRNQSHHNQWWQMSSQMCAQIVLMFCSACYLRFLLHGSFIPHVIYPFIISIKSLCCRLKQVRRLSHQHSVAQQVVSCHSLTCVNHGHPSADRISSAPSNVIDGRTFQSSAMLA